MSSSLELKELDQVLLDQIKNVFIQFIYKCIVDENKARLFICGNQLFKRLGHFNPIYQDISDAIMKAESTGKEDESLITSYHLTLLGIADFFSDIEKTFNFPIEFAGTKKEINFRLIHDRILPKIKS